MCVDTCVGNHRLNAQIQAAMPSSFDPALKAELIRDVLKYEAVKFGNFTLKSGVTSPIYLDIRICVSHPTFLTAIAEAVSHPAYFTNDIS